jgi:AraC-like DNA-binding protein
MGISNLSLDGFQLISPPFIHTNEEAWYWVSERAGYWNLWICQEGSATIVYEGKEYQVRPGMAFLFAPDATILGTALAGPSLMKNFAMHFQLSAQDTKLLRGKVLGQIIRETDTVYSLIRAVIRLSAFNDSFSIKQTRYLMLSLIALIWREHLHPTETNAELVIYRQLERIQAGQDMFSSVQDLAVEAGLSRIHYGRCFKRITNESPNRYLIIKRIERAKILLKNTQWSMDRIARAIGYAELYFFSRQFRREVGQSPSKYRET